MSKSESHEALLRPFEECCLPMRSQRANPDCSGTRTAAQYGGRSMGFMQRETNVGRESLKAALGHVKRSIF